MAGPDLCFDIWSAIWFMFGSRFWPLSSFKLKRKKKDSHTVWSHVVYELRVCLKLDDVYAEGNIIQSLDPTFFYVLCITLYTFTSKFSLSYLVFWKLLKSPLEYKVCGFKTKTNHLFMLLTSTVFCTANACYSLCICANCHTELFFRDRWELVTGEQNKLPWPWSLQWRKFYPGQKYCSFMCLLYGSDVVIHSRLKRHILVSRVRSLLA